MSTSPSLRERLLARGVIGAAATGAVLLVYAAGTGAHPHPALLALALATVAVDLLGMTLQVLVKPDVVAGRAWALVASLLHVGVLAAMLLQVVDVLAGAALAVSLMALALALGLGAGALPRRRLPAPRQTPGSDVGVALKCCVSAVLLSYAAVTFATLLFAMVLFLLAALAAADLARQAGRSRAGAR